MEAYYALHICILIAIYAILAISLDLVVGHVGRVSLAHASFYGIGAYTTALSSMHLGCDLICAMGLSMVLAGIASLVLSLPSRRLHEDYWVIATFGFQMVVVSIFSNWSSLTNGPLGIRDIPQPKLLGHLVTSRPEFAIIAVVIAFCAYKIVSLFITGAFGRVLHAVREDEAFAWSLGKNTFRPKLIAIAVSAMLAACSGSLYAYYLSYIDPSSFTITESILVFSMIIIGGAGTRWGSMIGAAFLVLTLEVLEWVGIPSTLAVNIRQLIYAFLLIGVLIRNPQGFGIPPPFSRRSGRA